jgi:hypothetical protein
VSDVCESMITPDGLRIDYRCADRRDGPSVMIHAWDVRLTDPETVWAAAELLASAAARLAEKRSGS